MRCWTIIGAAATNAALKRAKIQLTANAGYGSGQSTSYDSQQGDVGFDGSYQDISGGGDVSFAGNDSGGGYDAGGNFDFGGFGGSDFGGGGFDSGGGGDSGF